MIKAWSTKFAAVFDEYCITGAHFEIRSNQVSGIGKGMLLVGLDEKDATTPTATSAAASAHIDVNVNNAYDPIRHMIDWVPTDYLDLQWSSVTSSSVTPVYIKVYGDNTTTFLNSDTAGDLYITGALSIDFRGFLN